MGASIFHTTGKSLQQMYVTLCLLLVLLVAASFTAQIVITRQELLRSTERYLASAHQQSQRNIGNYLQNLEATFQAFCYNADLQTYLQEPDAYQRLRQFKQIQAIFSNLSMSEKGVEGFSIFNKQGQRLATNGSTYQTAILADQVEIPLAMTYFSIYPPNPYIGIRNDYYVLSVPVFAGKNGRLGGGLIGSVLVTMNQAYIRQQVNLGASFASSSCMLLDHGGNVLAGERALPVDLRSTDQSYNQERYLVITNKLPNQWELVSFLEKGIIGQDMQPILTLSLVIAGVIAVALLLFLITLQFNVLRPIDRLRRYMENVSTSVGQGVHTICPYTPQGVGHFAELSAAADTMNKMLDSLQDKTTQLLRQEQQQYETLLTLNRMEILAYRNQINPHFLYNTLDCIRGIALSRGAPEVAQISQSLSTMFRYAVKGGNFSTVAQELDHVTEYQTIIAYRFMGRIGFTREINQGALGCQVPRLLLQPLVENAVFHGVERQTGTGIIHVAVTCKGNVLRLTVSDNGAGMEPATLCAIRAQLEQVRSTGECNADEQRIGLENLARRLRLFYPKSSTLTIESTPSVGTTVTVCMEMRKEDGDVSGTDCR